MDLAGVDFLNGMTAPGETTGLVERAAWDVGVEVAGPAADDVDRAARFPAEAVAELKARRLLSAMIPKELGGQGASMMEMAGAVRALAFHCASSALVLAMHSIEISNLTRHGTTEPLQQLLRDIARDQLLIANANSEVGVGGDVGRSVCCLTPTDGGLFLDKQALAVSYGEYSDFIVSTARRTPESEETDQATMVLRRVDLTLEPTTEWNTLGLRGTCSRSFHIQGSVDADLIFPVPFSEIASQGGIQGRQILTSAVWVGLAEAGAAKAHGYVRSAARKVVGSEPPSALRLAEISVELQQARDTLAATALRFELSQGTEEMVSAGFVTALRSLKVGTSEMANRVLTASLAICGMGGYANESPMSLGRLIRDAHGGAIMVNNDRYLHDNARLLLARKNL